MSRIVFRKGRYYDEYGPGGPVENGPALFNAQLEHDLKSARRHQEKLRRELPKRIVRSSLLGLAGIILGSLFLWFFVSAVRWFWLHPAW